MNSVSLARLVENLLSNMDIRTQNLNRVKSVVRSKDYHLCTNLVKVSKIPLFCIIPP